jgi:hypothetical protein
VPSATCRVGYDAPRPSIDAIVGRVISLIVLTPGAQRAAITAGRDHYAAPIAGFVLQAITRSCAKG